MKKKCTMRVATFVAATLVLSIGLVTKGEAKPKYGQHLCKEPGYSCYRVHRGDTWRKLFPNKRERNIVKRLNRTNMGLYSRKWVVVPTNLKHANIMDVSPFPDHVKTTGEKVLVINLKLHAFGAYNKDGFLLHWGPISGGKGWCPDVNRRCNTVVGANFRVYRKENEKCVSNTFPVGEGGAKMPYCMFFYKGFAMHGSTLPGYHASHGCIRLFFDDAQWLNKSFVDLPGKGNKGTRVIVMRS